MTNSASEPNDPKPSGFAGPSGIFSNLRIVSLGTLVSRCLGMLRDVAMAGMFGAGTTLDTFVLAFRIPNLARQLLGEGALSTAFLPVFLQVRQREGDDAARAMLAAVAAALAMILSGVVVLAELAILIVKLTTNQLASSSLLLTLLVIMLPYMVLICVTAVLCAALHALRQFFWPTLVPIVLNTVWLIGVWLAARAASTESTRVLIVAVTIPLAGLLQLLIPYYALRRYGMGIGRNWRAGWPQVGAVFRAMLPVVVGMSILQFNAVLESLLTWGLARPDSGGPAFCEQYGIPPFVEAGTTAALYFGQRMYQFPQGIFGVALGTVLYPILTQHAQRGEFHLLRQDLMKGLRIVIALALPASAGLFILAEAITQVLFRHGNFDAEDALLTSRIVATYGAGTWSYIALAILNRAFYATGDRITAMRYALWGLVFGLPLSLLLLVVLGGVGLALGGILACTFQVTLALRRLNREIGPFDWSDLRIIAVKGLLCTMLMTIVCLAILAVIPQPATFVMKVARVAVPCLVGVVVYFGAARLTGLSEVEELVKR